MSKPVRNKAAIFLAGVAVLMLYMEGGSPVPPDPAPSPVPARLDLRGKFVGSTAAADAAMIASIAGQLAVEGEYDMTRKTGERLLTKGVAFDDMRRRIRDLTVMGDPVSSRQPMACKAIGDFLDATVGKTGGAITDEQQAAWIEAHKDVQRAAEAVFK